MIHIARGLCLACTWILSAAIGMTVTSSVLSVDSVFGTAVGLFALWCFIICVPLWLLSLAAVVLLTKDQPL